MRTPFLALAIFAALSQPAAAATFAVYPSPHTSLAAPGTQISFRGGPPSSIGAVSVTGSRSGRHTGTLKAHSDGQGASFVPRKAFTPGERVVVRTHLHIPGARRGDYGFTVGQPVGPPPSLPTVRQDRGRSFASRPDLRPPGLLITARRSGAAPGLIFLAPKAGDAQDGPMIIDDHNRLIWFHPIAGNDLALDFRTQTYQGKPVLTWWQGRQFVGDGAGVGEIYDQRYREVARVRASGGMRADMHEFRLTPRGTALLTIYQRDRMDLRRYGGAKDAAVIDGVVQEIDVKTGLLLFEWHSIDHVRLSESYVPAPGGQGGQWDYFHINSIDEDPAGDLIVSSRHTWTVYKLDRTTGNVIWRLGGKRSDFKLGRGAKTSWQHDARLHPDGTLTVFDNGASGTGPAFRQRSRAVTLRLDEAKMTATLVSGWTNRRPLLSPSQGNVQRLANGDDFVGYGSNRFFAEFSPAGALLLDGRLAAGNTSYRAYRLPWSGQPAESPRLAATAKDGRVQARVSWNGATDVARWVLLAGPSASAMTPVAEAPWDGFEVTLSARTTQPLVAVAAYDASGRRLAGTTPVKPAG